MDFSKSAFVEGFVTETREHLDAINNGIISLKNNPTDKSVLVSVLRDLHTIKGTSRMLGYPAIEELSHGLEDVFNGIRGEQYDLTGAIIQLTFAVEERISKILADISAGEEKDVDNSKYLDVFNKAASGLFFTIDSLIENDADNTKKIDVADDGDTIDSLENITSIRVELSRIDEVVRAFDNLIVRQFSFKHQLEEFEKSLNSPDIEIPRQLKEDISLTETAIFDTQRLLLDLRMLPLDIVLNPIKKEIENDAINLKKEIEVDIPKTGFMLDKAVLGEMRDILMHLVRNSLDHGIETPEERKAKWKPEKGLISIHVTQVSNYLKITVSDDGRGIDYEKIREKALAMNYGQEKQIKEMGEKELQQYLFMSGFSTKESVSAISGRGVGLDVVRTGIEKVKGRIHLVSKKDEGSSFELTVPLSLATQQGLFVYASNKKFMIPSQYVEEIIDSDSAKYTTLQGQNFISVKNQLVPVQYLSALFGGEKTKNSITSSIIVVEYLETHLAIVVDKISEYSNIVVTPLPLLIQNMSALQGVVYDENYAIVPILNISDTIQRLKSLVAYDVRRYEAKNETRVRTILVVDDSITTRQIEQMIFEKDGYNVETAEDGIEALEKLREKHIDAVVTDIDMPRMDGNVLLENIRRSPEYSKIPVIVVSGAYNSEYRKKFLDAGAQDFIVKSEFQRGNLLQSVKDALQKS